jgi:hypothetical protein
MSASAQAMIHAMEEEVEKQDPWFQSVFKYFLTMKEVREAIKRSRVDRVNQLLDRTVSFKNSLPPKVRNRIESLSGNLLARADSLPDVIKTRLPLEAVKRLS